MRKVIKIFLFLIFNIIYINSLTYTNNENVKEKIKSMAFNKIINYASDYTGEFNEFLDQGIDYINVYIAELNGENGEEAAVIAGFHYGEGGIEHYLLIYENIFSNPVLKHFKNIHGSTIHNNYHEITDLDNNGISEILIVGDGNSGYGFSQIFLYKLENNKLIDIIWGNDSGSAYYHFDVDNDNIEEIIGISKKDNTEIEIEIEILKYTNNYYKKIENPANFSHLLGNYLEKIIITKNHQILKHHDYEDLQLLAEAVKYYNISPSNIIQIQQNLEKMYITASEFDKSKILASMLWDEKNITKTFLQTTLTEELNKNQRNINSLIIKSIICSQLKLNDESGIDLLIEYFENKSNNYNKRKKIINNILGDLINQNQKCYDYLTLLYSETDNIEIKSIINQKFSFSNNSFIDIIELEKYIIQISNKDITYKKTIIKTLSNNYHKKSIGLLLKAYENPNNHDVNNEIIYAISNQIKNKPVLYKNSKIKNIINNYLIFQSSVSQRNKLLSLIGHIIDDKTIVELLEIEKDKTNLKKLFQIVKLRKYNNAVPYILYKISNHRLDIFTLNEALKAVSFSTTDDVRSLMKKYLNHKNKYIQITSIKYFSEIKNNEVEHDLLEIFNNHPDKLVRCHAAKALGTLGADNIEEILISNFNDYLNHYSYNEYIQGMLALESERINQYFIKEFEKLNKEKNYNYMFYICLDTIIKIDSKLISENLIEWTKPEYPDQLRLRAIFHLSKTEDSNSTNIIQSQLYTADRNLRKKIINALNNETDYNYFYIY